MPTSNKKYKVKFVFHISININFLSWWHRSNFFDGRKLSIPLTYFPRLSQASDNQRKNYTISGGGTGIHWDEIKEDINVINLLFGSKDRTSYSHIT